MSNWFECKAKYQKVDADGKLKMANEPYLIDAVSFTEAESRIYTELEPYIAGEFQVTNIKISNLAEIHPSDSGDRWFKCKVSFITIDHEKGLERRSNTQILVQSNTVKEAYDFIEKLMSTTANDYEIAAIQESPIKDVFPYFKEEGAAPRIPSNLKPLEEIRMEKPEGKVVYIDDDEPNEESME